MKPGPKDKPYPILITGRELAELKKIAWSLVEAFGLDRKIEAYQGKRPLGLYRWDLDCLEDSIALALKDTEVYPEPSGPEYEAMKTLYDRIVQRRKEAYEEFNQNGG